MIETQKSQAHIAEQFLHVSQFYCDYNATTPMANSLVEDAINAYKNHWLNPSAIYRNADAESKKIAELSSKFSRLAGTKNTRTIICSCATEATNQAIYSLFLNLGQEAEIVITDSEHSAVKKPAHRWFGKKVLTIAASDLQQDCAELKKVAGSPGKKVFFIQSSNNETGVVNPVRKIREAIGADNLLVLDASQSFGKQSDFFEVMKYADVVVLSPHKFYGPKGFGLLIWSEKAGQLSSIIDGGGQQSDLRGGTENTPALYLLDKWLDSVPQLIEEFHHVEKFRNDFEKRLLAGFENSFSLNQSHPRLMNTACVYIPNKVSELVVHALDAAGIMASSGSACRSGSAEPSKSYLAAGITWDKAHSVIRFSFGFSNLRIPASDLADQVIEIVKKS